MTTARKPTPPTDNLMLIVGQLLEATRAASDGLKSMSAEVQSNAKAIIAAVKTLEKIEDTVVKLDEIVSDATNPLNLLTVTHDHASQLSGLHAAVVELKTTLSALKYQVGTLGTRHERLGSAKATVWGVVKVISWIVTTAVAAFAAFHGK